MHVASFTPSLLVNVAALWARGGPGTGLAGAVLTPLTLRSQIVAVTWTTDEPGGDTHHHKVTGLIRVLRAKGDTLTIRIEDPTTRQTVREFTVNRIAPGDEPIVEVW